ncbi:ABC transporter ATP-binding protein (plasmid) [Pseudorhodobacter turbinis]|uniref:ABC transporter ATP-binding protein n=1 Tax=Pseudorhodobacter turbinis TaxID=2500533 RepID=A0A4V1E1C4_9RHOB|nr:ABC transporter ATP-binding protein [Pseudorhodobacter turbinis]QCO57644.1 ABC transporter ATP-binding protein [Pseudorhodobacter turbinis]
MTLLQVNGLGVSLRKRQVLSDVSLNITKGEVIGLIGANGAGKTTLMRAILGLVPHDGHSSLAALRPFARGRAAAWMPQTREIAWAVTVETLVTLGRTPHLAAGQQPTDADRAAVNRAIDRMDLGNLRARTATRLSGGEQARVLMARALAQETPLLMADEPIAGLDPAHQIATMECFTGLAAEGRSILVSLHDLGLAARYCTRLVVLAKGRVAADGPPQKVLTPALLRDAFGITAWFEQTAKGPVFQPLDIVT